jgi:hypothetical protein
MRTVRSFPNLLAVAALLASAGACTRQQIAPSFDTIVKSTEARPGTPPVHLLYVENRSTSPVTVYSAGVDQCENIADPCTPHPMDLRINPGEKRVVLRVTPADPSRDFSYRFAHSWRAGSLDQSVFSAPDGSPDVGAQQRARLRQAGDSARRTEAAAGYTLLLGPEAYPPLGGRVAALRVVGDSVVLAIGQTGNVDKLRFVLVDAAGGVLGSTFWVRWTVPRAGPVQFLSGREFVARAPGRVLLTFALDNEAQRLLGQTIRELAVPIVVVDTAGRGHSGLPRSGSR